MMKLLMIATFALTQLGLGPSPAGLASLVCPARQQERTPLHPKLEILVRPLLRNIGTEDETETRFEEIERLIVTDSEFKSQLSQIAQAYVRTETVETIPTASVRSKIREWAKLEGLEESSLEPMPTRAGVITDSLQGLIDLREDGVPWTYEGNYRLDGEIPLTYQVGGTSLISLAILYGASKDDKEASSAFRCGLSFVLDQVDEPHMEAARIDGYDMRVLAQAYALLFLRHAQIKGRGGPQTDQIAAAIDKLAAALVHEQMEDGGWTYQARPVQASFVTASVVQALLWARPVNASITDDVLARAARALESSRYSDGGYLYFGTRPSKPKRDVQDLLPGSIARAPICETMLFLLGRGSRQRVEQTIGSFYRHWYQLELRRAKPGTHDGPYMIAPYYFYYGHRYLGQAIEVLSEDRRPAQRKRLFERLLKTRSPDGFWNDRHFARSRGYSTAMVLLAIMSEDIGLPPAWKSTDEESMVALKAESLKEAKGPSLQRPEKYLFDPSKVMMKNVYVQLKDRSVRNVTPTPGEGFYGGACIHPEGRDVVFPGAAWGFFATLEDHACHRRGHPYDPGDFCRHQSFIQRRWGTHCFCVRS